jgi:hypothetical protein
VVIDNRFLNTDPVWAEWSASISSFFLLTSILFFKKTVEPHSCKVISADRFHCSSVLKEASKEKGRLSEVNAIKEPG